MRRGVGPSIAPGPSPHAHRRRISEHLTIAPRPAQRAADDGATIFRQACQMGLEGIVSKRLSAPDRSSDWIKVKNPYSLATQTCYAPHVLFGERGKRCAGRLVRRLFSLMAGHAPSGRRMRSPELECWHQVSQPLRAQPLPLL
jgi:hypothetical protein